MAVWIKVLQGDSPQTAEVLLATGDARVIAAVRAAIAQIIGTEGASVEGQRPARASALKLQRPNGDGAQ